MKTCSYTIYLFILFFAPLAFGASELWSISIIEVATVVSGLFLFFSIWFSKQNMLAVPGLLPLLLLILYMVFQLIPFPQEVVKYISPEMYNTYLPGLSSSDQWIPLTVNQKATIQEVLRISCYALFYLITIQLLSGRKKLRKVANIVIYLATAIAVLAIIQRVGSPDKIYWFRSVPSNASPFGPWVNPNQYAGFMGMVIPLAFAVFIYYKPRVKHGESFRRRMFDFFTMPGTNLHFLMGFATVSMSLSVFISLCRGGILALIFSICIFLILHHSRRSHPGKVGVWIVITSVVVAVSWFGWERVFSEFNNSVNATGHLEDGRFDIWNDSYTVIKAYFPFGSGFGTFVDVFPSVKTFSSFLIFDHAHNDYIELLTDGGIIGFTLAAWFVLAVLKHGWKMIRARRNLYAVLLGIGALTALLAALIHSVIDFNMHNGAIGLYFFFVCGFLVSVVNLKIESSGEGTLLKNQPEGNTKYVLIPVIIFGCIALINQFGAMKAGASYSKVSRFVGNDNLNESEKKTLADALVKAQTYDPYEVRYSYYLGTLAWQSGNIIEAREYFKAAIRKSPMEGTSLQWLGFLTHNEKSDWLIEEGYKRALNKDDLALRYINHLFWKGDREKALSVINERLGASPGLLTEWSLLFEKHPLTQLEIASVLPENVSAWINYGVHLENSGDIEGAEYYRKKALEFIPNETLIKPDWFNQLIRYYEKRGQAYESLAILRQGIQTLPDHAPFHVLLGDYYQKEGIIYRAKEEYEQALILDPRYKTARDRLRRMGELDSY